MQAEEVVVVIFPEQLDLVDRVGVAQEIHIHHLLVEEVLEHTPLVEEEEELEELMGPLRLPVATVVPAS